MDKLEEKLLEHQTDNFLVVRPGGNNGDHLIYIGLEKKLEELGINYVVLRYHEKRKTTIFYRLYEKTRDMLFKMVPIVKESKPLWMIIDDMVYKWTVREDKIQEQTSNVVLIHGGANLNDLWGHGLHLLRNVIKNNPHSAIIVAPQSYWFYKTRFQKLLKNSSQQICLFCRERYSYNLLRSMNLPENVHVYLSDDTAFYLSKKNFHPIEGSYDLICPRRDKESMVSWKLNGLERWEEGGIIDLRKSKRRVFVGDISSDVDFDVFVKLIEGARRVYTDRLHVAIFSAILAKETFLYPSYYYKSKGVYEFSLRRYPNVKFIGALEFSFARARCY